MEIQLPSIWESLTANGTAIGRFDIERVTPFSWSVTRDTCDRRLVALSVFHICVCIFSCLNSVQTIVFKIFFIFVGQWGGCLNANSLLAKRGVALNNSTALPCNSIRDQFGFLSTNRIPSWNNFFNQYLLFKTWKYYFYIMRDSHKWDSQFISVRGTHAKKEHNIKVLKV